MVYILCKIYNSIQYRMTMHYMCHSVKRLQDNKPNGLSKIKFVNLTKNIILCNQK